MNNIEDTSVQLEETNVVSSAKIKEMTKMKLNMTQKTPKRNLKKFLTAGLAASLVAALSIGAYAAFGGGLKDVSVSEGTITDKIVDDSGNVQESVWHYEYISLQGFSESAENQALREWMKFTDNYDTDGAILDKVGNKPTQWDEKYGEYTVYSQEMADKLDEITAKYGLTLHTHNIPVNSKQELDARFGEVMTDANYAGYCYEDGTFHVDGEFGEYDIQLGRTMKGVFDDVYLNIGDKDNYEQWTYETASGKTVLLALSRNKAIILADLDNSFVHVNVLLDLYGQADGEPKPMSKADLENMADHINFPIL